jgi:predicted RNA-binding protein YlxR (DUF448 family)
MLAAQDITQDNELDAGPRSSGSGTERFCVVTRSVKPVDELIRFVVGPDGVVPDLKRKLPGRGLWITADKKILADAIARKAFARGFKREVKVPADLGALTEQLLVQSALDALAIAGKARLVSAGFAKAEKALTRDRVLGLVQATEAAPDGVKKLAGVLRSRPDADRIPVIRTFNSAQLDLALGRSNVVHAALLAGPPSDTFLARFQRLERFRTGNSGESGTSRTPN